MHYYYGRSSYVYILPVNLSESSQSVADIGGETRMEGWMAKHMPGLFRHSLLGYSRITLRAAIELALVNQDPPHPDSRLIRRRPSPPYQLTSVALFCNFLYSSHQNRTK
jgi:hypothetical protein